MNKKSSYVRILCCVDCDWFESVDDMRRNTVCRECGGELEATTGRFIIETEKVFFGLIENVRYVGFERKPKD